MKLDLSKVEISRKDRNLGMTFPKELTKELAYLIGIHLGDGTMNHYTKYYYSIGYSGHAIDEFDFYNKQINALFYKFFNKKLNFYKKKSKTGEYIELATQSKGIFTFFKTSLGIMPGPKTHNKIPEIIKYSNFKVYFIRGFADSDFTLTFKKRNKDLHYYPVISLSTSNKLLLLEVNSLLDDLGLISCLTLDLPTKRYDKSHITHQMDINGEKMLELWMSKIGFNSRKHLIKYLIWKKFGFCPLYTTLPQREAILRAELDPYSFYKPLPQNLYKLCSGP